VSKTLKEFQTEQPTKAPKGWEPSIAWNGQEGTITTGPLENEPDPAIWHNLIADWGLDPNLTEVVDGTVQVRAWDANLGAGEVRRFKYYRATIRPRQDVQDRADIDALCKLALSRKPLVPSAVITTPRSLVVLLTDWQLGNGENGGSEAITNRILASLQSLVSHIKALKKLGRMPEAILLIGLGDIIEQCSGFYPMQEFTTDLDRRSQKRLGRRLLLAFVDELLQFKIPIVLGAVPGNHGENRRKGKAYTTWTDSDDLAVFEEIAEVLSVNPERYELVSVPTGAIADDLTMTLDVSGVITGFAHGHQMRSGGPTAQGKLENWFKGQVLGNQPVANAQVLFTGHLHHFVASEATGRTVIQCPAMDNGSYWFTSTTGQNSPAGMLVVGVGTAYGRRGWGDLQIL
jgi:hypothetical protein